MLDVVGETVKCKQYDKWIVYPPGGGSFECCADEAKYRDLIATQGGPDALREWLALEKAMEPMQVGAGLFPAAGMRGDIGVIFTALQFGLRAGLAFARTGLVANKLTGPFSAVVDPVRRCPPVLLCDTHGYVCMQAFKSPIQTVSSPFPQGH